jgi:hypothetical protein
MLILIQITFKAPQCNPIAEHIHSLEKRWRREAYDNASTRKRLNKGWGPLSNGTSFGLGRAPDEGEWISVHLDIHYKTKSRSRLFSRLPLLSRDLRLSGSGGRRLCCTLSG